MLQQMRQFSKSWIANIFLGALTLSFVSWGIGDIFRGGTSTAVATVGGRSIEQVSFQRDYNNLLRNEGAQRGKDLTPEQARKEGLGTALLQQDIAQTAMDNVASSLGMTATDAMVVDQIHAQRAFADLAGNFDRNAFLQAISRIGYSEQGFIEVVRGDLVRAQLVHAVESGFEIPPGYARALFAYSTEMRAAHYITIDAKSLPPIPPPADAVLEAYIKAHPDQFSTPEYRDVTYAYIEPKDVMGSVTVTDKQIQNVYDSNQDRYVIPERRSLEQLMFPTKADADAARAKITAGTSFEQIAASRGEKPADISLGDRVAADLDPAQSKPVFALPEGGVTEPLQSATGWTLIKVTKIIPGKTTTLTEATPEIKKALTDQLAQSKLTDIANAYTDASSGGLNLADAAKKVGMHTGHIPAMDASGLAPDGSKTSAPDDPDFRALVFKTDVGEEGDPVPAKTGAYYVVSVNGIVPPKLKPLSAVRDQALAGWTKEQTALILKKKAAELTALANKDKSLTAAAKSIGATVQTSQALSHNSKDDTFSAAFVTELFRAMPGEAIYGPKGSGEGYVVGRVSGIVHPLPPVNNPNYQQGVRMISSGVASGIVESFANAASQDQGVSINNKMLNSVLGGEGS